LGSRASRKTLPTSKRSRWGLRLPITGGLLGAAAAPPGDSPHEGQCPQPVVKMSLRPFSAALLEGKDRVYDDALKRYVQVFFNEKKQMLLKQKPPEADKAKLIEALGKELVV